MDSRKPGKTSTCEKHTETWQSLRRVQSISPEEHTARQRSLRRAAERQYRWFVSGAAIVIAATVALAGYGMYKLMF